MPRYEYKIKELLPNGTPEPFFESNLLPLLGPEFDVSYEYKSRIGSPYAVITAKPQGDYNTTKGMDNRAANRAREVLETLKRPEGIGRVSVYNNAFRSDHTFGNMKQSRNSR